MKRPYVKPNMEILETDVKTQLLAGSGEDSGNPYWDPPADKEGCETPWWCP